MELASPTWLQQLGWLLTKLLPGGILVAWCLWAVDWRKLWPVLAAGGWVPLVLIGLMAAVVWALVWPSNVIVLGFLPGPETGLVVAGLALCGAGLGLASQPLGRLALDGPSLPHDAAWTVVFRHAGLVLALAAVTPVLVSSLDTLESDAEAVGGEVVLRAPLPLQEKVPLLLELADVADTAAEDQPVDSQELLLEWHAAEARQEG